MTIYLTGYGFTYFSPEVFFLAESDAVFIQKSRFLNNPFYYEHTKGIAELELEHILPLDIEHFLPDVGYMVNKD